MHDTPIPNQPLILRSMSADSPISHEPAPAACGAILPKQERSRRTREKIIEAAVRLFDERGFEKTTSNDIAAAAGVSIGSFYVYFADKRQLLLLIFEKLLSERIEALFSNFHAGNPRKSIHQAIQRAFQNKCVTSGLTRIMHVLGEKDEDVAAIRGKLFQLSISHLQEILEKDIQTGLTNSIDVSVAANLIIHTVDALAYRFTLGEEKSDEEQHALIEGLTDMIFRYLFKPSASDAECCDEQPS
jgi:AcrR family transcriptional regulator